MRKRKQAPFMWAREACEQPLSACILASSSTALVRSECAPGIYMAARVLLLSILFTEVLRPVSPAGAYYNTYIYICISLYKFVPLSNTHVCAYFGARRNVAIRVYVPNIIHVRVVPLCVLARASILYAFPSAFLGSSYIHAAGREKERAVHHTCLPIPIIPI